MKTCRYCKQPIEEDDVVIDGMHEMCWVYVDSRAEREEK
jgi:hypothetical protein